MRNAGIRAVFVFDGRTPVAKSDVVDQRREARQIVQKEMHTLQIELDGEGLNMSERADLERRHASLQKKAPTVTSGDKNELKQFLYACGVQFVTAAGEADDVLGYLCRTGVLQGVISTDMDMLARGVPLLVIPETTDIAVLTEIRLEEVLSGLRLTYAQFVDACMLMGSDYSGKDWPGMEPRRAIEAVITSKDAISTQMKQGAALLAGIDVTWNTIVSEKQRLKWDAGVPPCEPDNVATAVTAHGWPTTWAAVLGCNA
jgi:5'-3' exonuclease